MENSSAELWIEADSDREKWEKFTVMYNPSRFGVNRGVNYQEFKIPGTETPIMQYVSGESKTMDLELVFDTYQPPSLANGGVEGGTNVMEITRNLERTLSIASALHRPPRVAFVWGKFRFCGIVTDLKQQFTMFLNDGTPVRAKVNLSLKSLDGIEESLKKYIFQSPDRTKVHTVCQGEQLWMLAANEYGDPEMWREIAKANDISNPLMLTPGQQLKIPAL